MVFALYVFIGHFFEAYLWSSIHKKCYLRYLVLLSSLTISAILPLLPMGYPWGFSVAINGFAFMLIGLIIKDLLEKILALRVWIIALIFVLCAVLSLSYKLNNPARGFVLMAHGEYGEFIPFMLGAFCGCCAVIMLAMLISKCKLLSTPLEYVGKQTLIMFAIHVPINNLLMRTFELYISNLLLLNGTVLAISVIVSVIAATIIARLIPALTGEVKRKLSV